MAVIAEFHVIRERVERTQYEMDVGLTEKVNKLIGKYQMEEAPYSFTLKYRYAYFMAPFQEEQLSVATYLFFDVTFTGKKAFPYLLNLVSLNEEFLMYNPVARVLWNKQDGQAYGTAFTQIFDAVEDRHPKFKKGTN